MTKTAKEMFEELGYIVSDDLMNGIIMNGNNCHSISAVKIIDRNYTNEDDYIEDETELEFQERLGTYIALELFFEKSIFEPTLTIREKEIKIIVDGDNFNIEFNGMGLVGKQKQIGAMGEFLSPKEIIAINKQIEELGWNKC